MSKEDGYGLTIKLGRRTYMLVRGQGWVEVAEGLHPKWSDDLEHEYVTKEVALGRSAEGSSTTSFFGFSYMTGRHNTRGSSLEYMRCKRDEGGLVKLSPEREQQRQDALQRARDSKPVKPEKYDHEIYGGNPILEPDLNEGEDDD